MMSAGELPEADLAAWVAGAVLQAAEATGIGVMLTVADGGLRTIYANVAAERLFGRSSQELGALDPLALLTQLERGPLEELATTFAATGAFPHALATTVTHRDGTNMSVEVGLGGMTLGGRFGVVSFISDVTARHAAIDSLRRSEARFHSVVEAVPEAVFITRGTWVEYANPAFRALVDLGVEEGRAPLDILPLLHPDDAPCLTAALDRLADGPAAHLECRLKSRAGGEVILELSAIGVEGGGLSKALWLGHDVTERRQQESTLLQADRLGVLGTLAAGMAHSINNPLSYTLLNLEHVARRMREVGSEHDYYSEARVRLAEAHDGAARVAKVVRQVRALSRARPSEPGPMDLRQVLDSVLAVIGNEIQYRGQLTTRFDPAPRVMAREGELEQSFLGLLLYVARSLPENAAGSRDIRLTVGTGAGGQAVVTVSDSGLALDAEHEARLFDPFSTGDATGLGLAMCRAIFTSLGGRIDVDSRPEHGSIFRIHLPPADVVDAFPAGRPTSVRPTPSPAPMAARARVLVIDDDPGVANTLRVMLEAHHDVRSVDRAREGLRILLGPDEFDIVFCDLMMPEVSGVDVYAALELNKPDRAKRLVFMTGRAFSREAERFLASIPNPCIEKPFSLARVEQLVARATEHVAPRAPL